MTIRRPRPTTRSVVSRSRGMTSVPGVGRGERSVPSSDRPVRAPSTGSGRAGRSPARPATRRRTSSPSTGAPWRGVAAEVEAGDLAPGERRRRGRRPSASTRVGVGGPDLAEDLVAAGRAGPRPGSASISRSADRLGEPDEAEVVEVAGEVVGGLGLAGLEAGQADLDQRAADPLPWASSLPSTATSVCVGAEPDAQAVPARLPGQPLDGQRGAAGRLDGQALLGPAEHRPDGLAARRRRGTSGRRTTAGRRRPRRCRGTRPPAGPSRPARRAGRSATPRRPARLSALSPGDLRLGRRPRARR